MNNQSIVVSTLVSSSVFVLTLQNCICGRAFVSLFDMNVRLAKKNLLSECSSTTWNKSIVCIMLSQFMCFIRSHGQRFEALILTIVWRFSRFSRRSSCCDF